MRERELEELMLKYLQGAELQDPQRQPLDNKAIVWRTFTKQLTQGIKDDGSEI